MKQKTKQIADVPDTRSIRSAEAAQTVRVGEEYALVCESERTGVTQRGRGGNEDGEF